jgi:hypothetical protein
LCGEPWEVCITHLCDSEHLKIGLCDHLSEERVERDPTLYELLNEDVEFFLNLNLRINSCVSLVLLCSLALLLLFTFLLSLAYGRYSLLSQSLVVLILLKVNLVAF